MQSTSGPNERVLGQIQTLLGGNAKLDAKDIDIQDFSRILTKMPPAARHSKQTAGEVISKLFEIASSKMKDDGDKAVLEGLRKYVATVEEDLYTSKPRYLDAFFFPNEKNIDRLVQYLNKAQKSLKICVFNLTNDRLANAIFDAHKRGVQVRVISDDECMHNPGSDIIWLAEQGVTCRTDDNAQFHMHNKFAVVDDTHLITGSFNWTV